MNMHASNDGAGESAGLVRGSLGLAGVALVLCGLLYSLGGVGLGQALFPFQAGGSIIQRDSGVAGSALVAQAFVSDRYFASRPSAAGYNPMALAGSNQARTNPALRERIEAARAEVAQREGVDPAEVPADLVTQSGGGIDPHISPQAAGIQVARVARARGLPPETVRLAVAEHTAQPLWDLFGAPRVDVLQLNLALDAARAD